MNALTPRIPTAPTLLTPVEATRRKHTMQQFREDPFRMLTDQELRDLFPACQDSSAAGSRSPHDGKVH